MICLRWIPAIWIFLSVAVSISSARELPKLPNPGEVPEPPRFSIPKSERVRKIDLLKRRFAELRRLKKRKETLEETLRIEAEQHETEMAALRREIRKRQEELRNAERERELQNERIARLSETSANLQNRLDELRNVLTLADTEVSTARRATLSQSDASTISRDSESPQKTSTLGERFDRVVRVHRSIVQDGNLIEITAVPMQDGERKTLVSRLRFGEIAVYCPKRSGSVVIGHPNRKPFSLSDDAASAIRFSLKILRRTTAPEITDLSFPRGLLQLSDEPSKSDESNEQDGGRSREPKKMQGGGE